MPRSLHSIQFNYYGENNRTKILETLLSSLIDVNLERYYDDLGFILNELLENANKANLKRIYFLKKNLNINDPADYDLGIKKFKTSVFNNQSEFEQIAVEYGIPIVLDFLEENENLIIQIVNNQVILPIERKRINSKIELAHKYNSMEDVVRNSHDTVEGGGLGLIFVLFILARYGLDESILSIESDQNKTVTRLSFPINLIDNRQSEVLAEIVVQEIEDLPQIQSHIMTIIRLIDNPSANFESISELIKEDASLIAEIIKVANSSIYILPHKITTIEESVRLLGIKSIRNLIITLTTSNILKNKYKEKTIINIMKHSSEVAFYAYELVKEMHGHEILDNVFIGAMLHDIGKIIIESIDKDLYKTIDIISKTRKVNPKVLETLSTTVNHSLIGSKLASKWNFPSFLVEAIRYHHIPHRGSDDCSLMVMTIYLADSLYYYRQDFISYDSISKYILKKYGFKDRKHFDLFSKKLFKKLENQHNYHG